MKAFPFIIVVVLVLSLFLFLPMISFRVTLVSALDESFGVYDVGVTVYDLADGKVVAKGMTDSDGVFSFRLPLAFWNKMIGLEFEVDSNKHYPFLPGYDNPYPWVLYNPAAPIYLSVNSLKITRIVVVGVV